MIKFTKILIAAAFLALPVGGAVQADMNDWKKSLIKKIREQHVYPRSAMVKEIEGKAKVKITIGADGTITNHEIVQATGENVLDNEIPKFVERLNPLPPLPDGKTELSITIPINWKLN